MSSFRRGIRIAVCAVSVSVLAPALGGCAPSLAPQLVLKDTPLIALFPSTSAYRPIEPSVKWVANDASDVYVSNYELRALNTNTTRPSVSQYGAACATILGSPPYVNWVEVGQQSVSYGQTVEIVSIIRTASVRSAEKYVAYRIAEMHVCSTNQGSAVYTPINAEVPDTAAFSYLSSPTGESEFVSYGRVGQYLIEVAGDYPDGPTIGAKTFKIVMTHVNALARKANT